MNTQTTGQADRLAPLQAKWDTPLTPKQWDERFPGILDGIALMGGAANTIMQLARMPVGYGVMESKVDSGNIFKRPMKRTRTTLTYLAVAMLGTTEEKLAYRRAVNTAHVQVRSEEGARVSYNAFDPELQLWVTACLYFGFVDMNERFYGTMSPEKAAEFYRLAEPLGTTLQVRPGMWPENIEAFNAYWEEAMTKLEVDAPLRKHLTMLAEARFLSGWQQRVAGPINRFFTIGLLPPKFRALMHFEWTPAQQKKFDFWMGLLATLNRHLPRAIRQRIFVRLMADMRLRMAKGLPLV